MTEQPVGRTSEDRDVELPERWDKVTALLGSALALERARIGDDEADVVQDYLDQTEFALAHDQLIDAIGDNELMPLDETRRLLGQAGRLMDHRRTPVEKEIEEQEVRLRAAVLAGDVDALDRLISPFATYTDPTGRRVFKSDDLAAYRSGLKVATFDLVDEMIIRCPGDTAIVSLVADVAGCMGDQMFAARLAYTRVWACYEGTWRVEAAHSSAVADAAG